MDFEIPARVKPLVKALRAFVQEQVIPLEPAFLNGEFHDLLPQLEQVRGAARAAGLWSPHLPKSEGGLGLSLHEFAYVSPTALKVWGDRARAGAMLARWPM